MARRKNTAEAFEILYRRSREKMSGKREPESAAAGEAAPESAERAAEPGSDRLPVPRQRAGAPVRPRPLLRRPSPPEPVLRPRTGARSVGRRVLREIDASGELAGEELYPLRYQPRPYAPAPWRPARDPEHPVYRVGESAPGEPARGRDSPREPTAWLPRWLPSRRARETRAEWSAADAPGEPPAPHPPVGRADGPGADRRAVDDRRADSAWAGYAMRDVDVRWRETAPPPDITAYQEYQEYHRPPAASARPLDGVERHWAHRQTEYREADGYVRRVGDIFSAPGSADSPFGGPIERRFVGRADRADILAAGPAARARSAPDTGRREADLLEADLREAEPAAAREAEAVLAEVHAVAETEVAHGAAAHAEASHPASGPSTASAPVIGSAPIQGPLGLGPGGSPLREPAPDPLRPPSPPAAGSVASSPSRSAGTSSPKPRDAHHAGAGAEVGTIPQGAPPTPAVPEGPESPPRAVAHGPGATPSLGRRPLLPRPDSPPGQELRAAVIDAARQGARWVLGDGLSEALGRRVELRVGTLVGTAMATIVVGALLIVSAEVRREKEVYGDLFSTPAGSMSAGLRTAPARDEPERELSPPPPMPLLGPMDVPAPPSGEGGVRGVESIPPAAAPRPGASTPPLDGGLAAADTREPREPAPRERSTTRAADVPPDRRYSWFVRIRGMCYQEEAEDVMKYFATRLGYACRMEPERRDGEQETKDGRPLFAVFLDELFASDSVADRVCEELKRKAMADPYEKSYMRNFEGAYAIRRRGGFAP